MFGNNLTLPRLPRLSLFSDRHASLSGASWPFFPAFPPFLSSAPPLALHPSVSATSHAQGFPFCTAFVHQVRYYLFNNLVAQFVAYPTLLIPALTTILTFPPFTPL